MIRFSNLKIRYKLLIAYSAVFILSITLGSVIIYSFVRQTVERNIERELTNTTATILNMVRTAADVSIKNHLRAVAEKNREIAEYYYGLYQSGQLTEAEAKDQVRQIMMNQPIGTTGYIYCVDSQGKMRIHPSKELIGADLSQYAFMKEQTARKSGYLEYDWKNPEDSQPRSKALYMTYFEPWDWIISASSYRSEFRELVDPNDFRESILSLRFGETGYSYILDSSGNIVLHPKLEGNYFDAEDMAGRKFVRDICLLKNGKITYTWRIPGTHRPGEKIVIFNYIPEFDWIVASTSYLDEIYAPLKTVQRIFLATVIVAMIFVLPITLRISSSITDPLQRLTRRLSEGTVGKIPPPKGLEGKDEVEALEDYFDIFMKRLDAYSASLTSEIAVRKQAEAEIRKSEEKYRQLVDTMPSVVVGVDLDARVTQWNQEAVKMSGRTPGSAFGRDVFELLPQLRLHEEDLRQAIRQKISVKKEKVTFESGHAVSYHDITVYPLTVTKNEGAVVRMDDITSRVRIENVMVQTEKMMSVGGLAAGMAHEINNPLGGILQSLQNVFRRLSPDLEANLKAATALGSDLEDIRAYLEKRQIIKFLEDIRESGTRASRTVENMLNFSRNSESRKMAAPLAGLLNQTVELAAHDYDLKKKYDFRDIRIDRDFSETMPQVPCVATEIEQVVLNLLRNAAQALASGPADREPVITLRLRHDNDTAIIEVEDNGPGMDETTCNRVFEPFFTTKEIGVGTGLGLSVSYFIIANHHNGTITVESSFGKGARFTIQLPIKEESNP